MADASNEVLLKAYTIGEDVKLDKAIESVSTDNPADIGLAGAFTADIIDPPYDPMVLSKLFEHANSLRQNVDSYKTNIDGFGFIFEPLIELRESGSTEMISDAIYLERAEAARSGQAGALEALLPPTDEEIQTKIRQLRAVMRLERARAESFFQYCVAEESFVALRRKTREDVEVTGNGYWEVIRSADNSVSQFAYMPSRSVRVAKSRSKVLQISQPVRIGLFGQRSETYRRRFRRYIQLGGTDIVYFKEFGDPTIVSSKTGKEYATAAVLQLQEPDVAPANEVLHFKIHSIRNGSYGVPRWIGNLLSVLGSRAAEEVNAAYFDNKSIPPMAILVSGGRLGDESVKRIQDFVEVQIKGRKSFHKILVIEAESTAGAIGLQDNASAMRLEIKQLTDAQLKDGLFRDYDSANIDKVGMSFRLPRLLRGDIRDFNRASAQSALDFAESQVFVPERNDFDFMINRLILPSLGIWHWRFKSLGPRLSDSQDWGEMIAKLTIAGVLTPQDARELASKKVLSAELPVIDEDWVRRPLPLSIAGIHGDDDQEIQPSISASADPARLHDPLVPDKSLLKAAQARVMRKAKELLKLRDVFREQAGDDAVKQFREQREEDGGELVFRMTADELESVLGVQKNKP
jgi:PBSX family phage portal protein